MRIPSVDLADHSDFAACAVETVGGGSARPKRLARSYRFTVTVLAIDAASRIDWSDVAARAGYVDQAHFAHEFREFTGLTPTRYVEVRRRFLREHPDHALEGWPLPAD